MKKIMDILFLSCLKASLLIEKKMHVKLTITQHLQLKIHKMMCDACTAYEKQSIILEEGIKNQLQQKDDVSVYKLKHRIHTHLNKMNK